MRVRLKGINRVRAKLKSGKYEIYYYAWKGGPRIEGKIGTPEFLSAYHAAWDKLRRKPTDTIGGLILQYSGSPDFDQLAERTRKDYSRLLLILESEFGDFPLAALVDRRARGDFLAWRDRLAAKSRRQADYAFAVLARVLSWGLNRGLIQANPCERSGKVYRANRSAKVWEIEQEARFLAAASPQLQLAMRMALWTGQRQGDLLRLTWGSYNGNSIKLKQGKTGTRVEIPVSAELKAILDQRQQAAQSLEPKTWKQSAILLTERGTPWTDGRFRASWRRVCRAANISGISFHDLRGTAVSRLARAGCTVPEIATITGHSLKDVGSVLDSHYLHRSTELAKSAIAKLERAAAPSEQATDVQGQIGFGDD